MCTLSFLQIEDEFIFTSNRDEHESRAQTLFPVIEDHKGSKVYFPQDPKAGGTWLATNDNQRIAILLNGAFEKHKHRPPYRKSRGLVLLDLFDFDGLSDFNPSYELSNIEPFTIIEFDINKPDKISEFRWDGSKKYFRELDGKKAHIWSSAQLYPKDIRQHREEWFSELLTTIPTAESLSHFHEFGGYLDVKNNLKMDRGNGLRTISISQLTLYKEKTKFTYRNLVSETQDDQWIIKNN